MPTSCWVMRCSFMYRLTSARISRSHRGDAAVSSWLGSLAALGLLRTSDPSCCAIGGSVLAPWTASCELSSAGLDTRASFMWPVSVQFTVVAASCSHLPVSEFHFCPFGGRPCGCRCLPCRFASRADLVLGSSRRPSDACQYPVPVSQVYPPGARPCGRL